MQFVARELLYHLPSSLAALLVTACPSAVDPAVETEGRPDGAEIERVERAIARSADPCVGELDRLVRSYRFLVNADGLNQRYIQVRFFTPAEVNRIAGRYADLVELGLVIHGPAYIADGVYDRQRSQIDDWFCGKTRWIQRGDQLLRIQGRSLPVD